MNSKNTERLPRGIKGLSERIDGIGMKFGLWFEPEMIKFLLQIVVHHMGEINSFLIFQEKKLLIIFSIKWMQYYLIPKYLISSGT